MTEMITYYLFQKQPKAENHSYMNNVLQSCTSIGELSFILGKFSTNDKHFDQFIFHLMKFPLMAISTFNYIFFEVRCPKKNQKNKKQKLCLGLV